MLYKIHHRELVIETTSLQVDTINQQKESKTTVASFAATSVTRCLNKKYSKFIQKLPKNSHSSFSLKLMSFQKAPKVFKYLGHFYKKICHQELQKSPNLATLNVTYDTMCWHRIWHHMCCQVQLHIWCQSRRHHEQRRIRCQLRHHVITRATSRLTSRVSLNV